MSANRETTDGKQTLFCAAIPILFFICVGVFTYVYISPKPVNVKLMEGQIQVKPAALKGIQGPVQFHVENQGAEPHQFIMVSIKKPPGQLPVKDGEAQFFAEPTDINDRDTWNYVIYDGAQNGGFAMPGPQPNPPLGPPMQPGEKRMIPYGFPGMKASPRTITILCNLPGHYEQGEYATVTINK